MIDEQTHGHIDPFAGGDNQIAGIHQVGTVSNTYENVFFTCHGKTNTGRNFVGHAGVAKIQVALFLAPGIPKFMYIARQAARHGHHIRVFRDRIVYDF